MVVLKAVLGYLELIWHALGFFFLGCFNSSMYLCLSSLPALSLVVVGMCVCVHVCVFKPLLIDAVTCLLPYLNIPNSRWAGFLLHVVGYCHLPSVQVLPLVRLLGQCAIGAQQCWWLAQMEHQGTPAF